MVGMLFFGVGFVFVIAMVLSLLASPSLAPREESAEDAGSKEPGS